MQSVCQIFMCIYFQKKMFCLIDTALQGLGGSTFLKLALVEDSIESRSERIEICPDDSVVLFFPW
jgi:hypothetical protein